MNRALVIKSFASLENPPQFIGESHADDVLLMRRALQELAVAKPSDSTQSSISCGDAGTVLRFLALRISRMPGVHKLKGSARLFARPQAELIPILNQLGVDAEMGDETLTIRSQGWRLSVDGLHIHAERSSQFASAVFLSAWDLPFVLPISLSKKMVSESYLRMTLQMVRDFGMHVQGRNTEFIIPAYQKVTRTEPYRVEPDLSSAFAVAALAVVGGYAEINDFPRRSLQPDAVFVKLLTDMGASLRYEKNALIVEQSKLRHGVRADLNNSPDLFPILGVLCAIAHGRSEIRGIGHLKFKESSRFDRTRELVEWMGAKVIGDDNGDDPVIIIEPTRSRPVGGDIWIFDADRDHRMAMAAEVARWAGFPIQVGDMKVVSKSFPEFAQISSGEPSVYHRGEQ